MQSSPDPLAIHNATPPEERKLLACLPVPGACKGTGDHGATSSSPEERMLIGVTDGQGPRLSHLGSKGCTQAKQCHILIFQPSVFTIDISITGFLKLQVSRPHLWGSTTREAFKRKPGRRISSALQPQHSLRLSLHRSTNFFFSP